jgi:peptidoglycan hydrolase CwlO-like protein
MDDFQQHKSHCEHSIKDLKEEISGLERRLKEKGLEIHKLEETISNLEKKIRELGEESS